MSNPVKNIAILGSTGSIGRNSLQVISSLSGRFRAAYLTAHKNIDLLERQVAEYHPRAVAVIDERGAVELRRRLNGATEVLCGEEGLEEIVTRPDVDIVISSLVGFAGLKPTIAAIKKGKTIALANKETLVVAGEIIAQLQKQSNVTIIPIDSEHSAILQCLAGENRDHIAKLILTASGGPFLNIPREQFNSVTVEQALRHPNWSMGRKITIDSATLMNKGLEVIEAHWLFGLEPERIEVLIHPQSIIHSMVEFVDGSLKAQLGVPDMKIPIQYALTYPHRSPMNGARVDFPKLHTMTFARPDYERFPCLQLAFDALKTGGTAPATLNAANEVAVEAFLERKIPFTKIPVLIEAALEHHTAISSPSLAQIIETDRETRAYVASEL
jgi:1-deoxy-D-xylulose-5-phosphate reductoisomerase